jgi:predicted amidohydrolase
VTPVRAALVQLCSGDNPAANLPVTEALVREAAAGGAALVLTPECTNIVSASRARQAALLAGEADDPTLARLRALAAELRIWLLAGSLCLKGGDPDGRFVNRSLLIAPDGRVRARYDKIHMFDVDLDGGERYRESAAYRPGRAAVLAAAAGLTLGLTVCYDMRFPHLYRDLARAGAEVLTVPSAFTVPTGRAHWHVLLRARAIETGAYVLAPAQSGEHAAAEGRPRATFGHSLAVGPWGEVLLDLGEGPGVGFVEIDQAEVARARARVPALGHDRPYAPPGSPSGPGAGPAGRLAP